MLLNTVYLSLGQITFISTRVKVRTIQGEWTIQLINVLYAPFIKHTIHLFPLF